MSLTPEFLCVIEGVVSQIGDIAVMARGDIAVSVHTSITNMLRYNSVNMSTTAESTKHVTKGPLPQLCIPTNVEVARSHHQILTKKLKVCFSRFNNAQTVVLSGVRPN
jgi:hypothetical protein